MMMLGYGSYGNGGGDGSSSLSSSSNLSALAQPFTVDRSVPKPLVDLTEPPLNWLNTHSFSFDSMPSSNAYGYPFTSPGPAHIPPTVPVASTDAFLYGQASDAIKTTNLVEAKPYYPSYVSPTKFSYDDYTQSLSGLWEGSRGWEYGKKVEIDENFCSKEMNVADLPVYKDYMDQGVHSSKVLNTCEEQSHCINMLGSAKHVGPANREQFDYKSFQGQNTEFMPVEYSRKSFFGSTSVFPETYSLASSSEQVRSRKYQMPYSDSFEKGVKKHDISPNDITSIRKSSSGLVIGSAVGSVSSAPNTSSFNNIEIGSLADNKEFAANCNFSSTKDLHPMQSSEGKVCFDSNQVKFHLDGDNYSFSELSLEKNQKLLSDISVPKDPFMANSPLQVPVISAHGLNLTLDGNESINCFENSKENLDHYNPAVDSPCWKGARVSQYSPLETSGSVTPQLTKTTEECSGSNLTGPTNNAGKFSRQKPSEFSLYQGNGFPENALAPSPERFSVSTLLSRELSSDDNVKEGSYQMKSSCGHGFQLFDEVEKSKTEYALSKKSRYESNLKPSNSVQQGLEEAKLTSEMKCESGTGSAYVGMNTGDSSEVCSSHVPFYATEHVLSSPPPVEAAPAKLTKLHGEDLAPKICVQTLINTMHNLSELLLFHCSNEACELKEQDLAALKNVVNNLDNCILKNLGPVDPSQESMFPVKPSQFLRHLPELHEGVTLSRHQGTKAAAVTILNRPDYQHVQEEKKHYIVSDKLDENLSDFASVRGDANRVKDDDMTQAIKKVLSENFSEDEGTEPQILLYKNLWLEAEATLCSINYRARYNQMKIEMEKCNSLKDLSESATAASDSNNNAEQGKLSQATVSSDVSTAIKLKSEVNDDSTQDISVPEFPTMTKSSHPDDVVARFHILKRQVDNANCMSTADVEKLWSSKVSSDVNKFDKMASEVKDDQTPLLSTWDSLAVGNLLSSKVSPDVNKFDEMASEANDDRNLDLSNWDSLVLSPTRDADDVEASVMARFQILKSHIDNSSYENTDGELLPEAVDLGAAGARNHRPEDEILDVIMEPLLQHNSATYTEDKLTLNEFHLHVKDDPVIHFHRTNRLGNQLPAGCYDSSSSDWEHVLVEELPEQNC